MDAKTRRDLNREDLRAKILDAARVLFVSRGYEGATLRGIGKSIGYTATILMAHFGSKEGLVFALCDADFQALRARFERIAKVADPIERVRKFAHVYLEFAIENPNNYRFMFMKLHPPEAVEQTGVDRANPDQDAYAFLRATVAEGLVAGRYRDGLNDPDLIAQALWSGTHGLVSLHLTKGADPCLNFRPVKAAAKLVIDSMLRGLVKEGT